MTQQEVLAFVDDVEPDEGDDDPEEGTTEKRSNREKLLAGETV
jgi:hypothetical protein